jgi:hypothetical protein
LTLIFVTLNIVLQCLFKAGVIRINHLAELNIYHS